MPDIIFKTLVTFFAIYGFTCVVKDIVALFFKGENDYEDFFIVIKVQNNAQSLESTVRMIIWKWLFLSRGRGVPDILIVDKGSDDDTAEIAIKLSEDYSFIHYTTYELYQKAKNEGRK